MGIGLGSSAHGFHNHQGFIYCSLDIVIGVVIRCQRLNSHGGHVVNVAAIQRPAAVGQLFAEDVLYQSFPCGGSVVCGGIILGVQRDQRKDRAVDTLSLHVIQIRESLQQIVTGNIGHILADGSEAQNHTGVIGGLLCMKSAVEIDVLGYIGFYIFIIGIHEIGRNTISRQT